MMTLQQRQVTVQRTKLLAALKTNLAEHRKEYLEAITDYRIKLAHDLTVALAAVQAGPTPDVLKIKPVEFAAPENHEQAFTDVIEMMEESADDLITIDSSSFKAYFKNEWSWSSTFKFRNDTYKAFAGSVSSSL